MHSKEKKDNEDKLSEMVSLSAEDLKNSKFIGEIVKGDGKKRSHRRMWRKLKD